MKIRYEVAKSGTAGVMRIAAYGSPYQGEDKYFPRGTTMVGFRTFREVEPGVFHIIWTRVREDCRGQGIARKMVEWLYQFNPPPRKIIVGAIIHPAILHVVKDMVVKYPKTKTVVLSCPIPKCILTADEVRLEVFKRSKGDRA